jgi:hypothetical protein
MDIADRICLRLSQCQELFDGPEKRGNLPVMFLDLTGDVLVRRQKFT